MARTKVFVTQPVPEAALARLRESAEVRVFPDSTRILPREHLLGEVGSCDVLFCLMHDRIDREVIEAGQSLRLIATSAIYPGNLDMAAATARKIPVTGIPNLVAETTADLQWGLLMAVARRIAEADRAVRRRMFPGSQSMYFIGAEVNGKTLGTIGLGAVGRGIARRARGFGMTVLYTKRNRLDPNEEAQSQVRYATLEDLLRESDFVVVNASYHQGTHHLLSAKELGLMKPTAFLINTSRGPIVDEQALVEALQAKRIAGAALDVYEHEPQVHPELPRMDNVVLTPHIGSAARETRERIAGIVVDNILAFLAGDRPPNLINAEVLT